MARRVRGAADDVGRVDAMSDEWRARWLLRWAVVSGRVEAESVALSAARRSGDLRSAESLLRNAGALEVAGRWVDRFADSVRGYRAFRKEAANGPRG